MKKTLILATAVVILLGAIYLIEQWTSPAPGFFGAGKKWYNPDGNIDDALTNSVPPKVYPSLRTNVLLYAGSDLHKNEVEVLQRYINLYDGANTVPVTGNYDDFTANAVERITGKPVTTLHEFRYMYMVTKGLNEQADKIVKGLA